MLEITLWDQARVREEESEFLGEVSGVVLKLKLFVSPLYIFYMIVSKNLYFEYLKSKHNLFNGISLATVLRQNLLMS